MKFIRSSACIILMCGFSVALLAQNQEPLQWHENWPNPPAKSIDIDEAIFVEQRLAQMSTEEKVAQMLMLEHNALSADEAKTFKIGAMLHAAGQAAFYGTSEISLSCRKAKYFSLACWGELADSYWNAVKKAKWDNNATPIPLLWSTDAMHGAGAIHGATLFPHNIGIGAAILGNPDNLALYQQMHEATREQVALQGFRQIFGPTVSVGRNIHWGRTYESLSENPALIYEAAPYAVQGIQSVWPDGSSQRMAATLKHFVGDGGTTTGTGHTTRSFDSGFDPQDTKFNLPRTDRGLNEYSETLLLNLHSAGYLSGIDAGAMSVMVSLNDWDNGALHGDKYLIQEILKDRLQFDGIVVTDWEGITHVKGCTLQDCPQAINAGVDLFMFGFATPGAWKDFYKNTLKHVEKGTIPMARIDDAARRMLRVKYRLGLFSEPAPPKPSQTYLAFGYQSIKEAQASLNKWANLSQTLAEKSMVLMKNEHNILPLKQFTEDTPLLVTGRGLNSPTMMVGGWSLYWQGFDRQKDPLYNHEDYPQTVTVLNALKSQGVPICQYDAQAPQACAKKAKVALVVTGENSYAEWYGDIHVGDGPGGNQSIAYASLRKEYAADEKLIKNLKNQGYQVITVFLSGRPLVVDALNQSDVFIAGFQPGSQGGPAIVDLLFANQGKQFEGRLPFTWPTHVEQGATFHSKPTHFPGDDNAWSNVLQQEKAKEFLVGPEHPYPYGYGLVTLK